MTGNGDEPGHPRFILGLHAGDIDAIRRSPEAFSTLRDPDIRVVELPLHHADTLARRLYDAELLRRGEVLMRNPFDRDEYLSLTGAAEQLALAKFNALSMFCALLGVRAVRVEQIERVDESGRTEQTVNLSAVNLEGGRTDEVMFRMLRSIRHETEFEPREPDLDAAEAFLRSSGLAADATATAIVKLCRAGARLTTLKQNVNLTSEARHSMERFWRISFPAELGELNPVFRGEGRLEKEYSLSLVIEF
jgi:hypothetical protein